MVENSFRNPFLRPVAHPAKAGILLLLLLGRSCPLPAQAALQDYQVKSVFLYNFTQFVEWPADALGERNTPFVIGILGSDPFGPYLDETVAGENLSGHPLIVQRFTTVKNIQNCQILFVSTHDPEQIKAVLSNLGSRKVLTVGEAPNFMQLGGMIRFFTWQNKIRLEINPYAAKAAGLVISSKLLRVAEIYEP